MAAVEVTISGVLYDKLSRSTRPVVLIGEASLTGLEIGGGPLPGGPGGLPPLGIWGPPGPWVTPPIANVPGVPGYRPPGGPGTPPGYWGGGPHPMPPVHYPEIPPKPTEPPEDGVGKPPPPEGGWGYHPEYGWGYFPPSTEPSPKA